MDHDNDRSTRGLGGLLIACAAATIALLAGHPSGGGATFSEVLQQETAQRTSDAIVHGGMVLVLILEVIGFLGLATRLSIRRTWVLAALVFGIAGAMLLSASMVIDGLITPAVAARYVTAAPERQDQARPLFTLIGAAIGVLMPAGLAFQGAAAIAWGMSLMTEGLARASGIIGLIAGTGILGAAVVSLEAPHALMIAALLLAVWPFTAGVLLWRWSAV